MEEYDRTAFPGHYRVDDSISNTLGSRILREVSSGHVPVEIDEATPQHFRNELFVNLKIVRIDAATGKAENPWRRTRNLVDIDEIPMEIIQKIVHRGIYPTFLTLFE